MYLSTQLHREDNQGLGKSVLVRSQCELHIMIVMHNFAVYEI